MKKPLCHRFRDDLNFQPGYILSLIVWLFVAPKKKRYIQRNFYGIIFAAGILHCLNNEARIAYIFRDIVQLPYEEISQIMRKDTSAVRQLISRSRRKLRHFLENECALHNPNGTCACRMKKMVMEMDLPKEYKKLRKIVDRANVFKEAEQVLPRKNYWEKFL
jgi:RNA polymerase sigma-70 factor (ECF subfamily)